MKKNLKRGKFMENEKIRILWTGGFDSTFRMVQLSRKDVIIEPHYVSDNRKSEQFELNAMAQITKALMAKAETCCTILPLVYVPVEKRISHPEVDAAFKRLLENRYIYMGSQYSWLGSYAKEHPGIEMSIHTDDKAIAVIHRFGSLIETSDPIVGMSYVVDPGNSTEDLLTVFENYRFPLAHYTKLQMMEEYNALGCADIIPMTWFCFSPRNGKPCGVCNPCKYTIEEGLKSRFSSAALRRYRYRKILERTKIVPVLRSIKSWLR